MKCSKIIVIVLAVALALSLGCICFNKYIIPATVAERGGDEIAATDCNGNIWGFYVDQNDTLTIGDNILLIMHTNGTKTIFDDIVINYIFL